MKQIILLFLLSSLSLAAHAQDNSAKKLIENFYKSHMENISADGKNDLKIGYSASLTALLKKNEALCAGHEDEVCGWGADGDVYLDAQDWEEGLNYRNSGFTAQESGQGIVTVQFNLFPSEKGAGTPNLRTLTYVMVQEGGKWLVDDIRYSSGETARRIISDENSSLAPKHGKAAEVRATGR